MFFVFFITGEIMNYASFGCAMRKVSLLCVMISFDNAYGMQLALVGQSPRMSLVEKERKNFSEAMHRMQELPQDMQRIIALHLLDHHSDAVIKKILEKPPKETMKNYANTKAIFNKETLRHFGEAAFDPGKPHEWSVGTIFALLDEISIVNKLLAKKDDYVCNKTDIKAFVAVSEKFNQIKFQKSIHGDISGERKFHVAYRDAYTILNFLNKITPTQMLGELTCQSTYIGVMMEEKFGITSCVAPCLFSSASVALITITEILCGKDVKDAFKKWAVMTGLMSAGSFAIDQSISLAWSFISSPSKDRFRFYAGFSVSCHFLLASLLYNMKQMAKSRSKLISASTLSEALNDPNIVIP